MISFQTSTFKMMKGYFVTYPYRVIASTASYFAVSMADIVGVAALFPLLTLLGKDKQDESNKIAKWFFEIFETLGVDLTIGWALATIFIVILSKTLLTIGATVQTMYASAYVGADFRSRMINAHTRAKWSLFQKLPAGRLASVISHEVQLVSSNYQAFARLIADLIRTSIHLVFAAFLAWEVTLAAIGVGMVAVILLARLMTITRNEGRELANSMANFSARLVDGLSGMKPLKAMAKEFRLTALLGWEVHGIQRAERKLGIVGQSTMAIQEPIMVGALALGLFLMWESWQGQMEVLLVLALVFLRSVQTIFSLQKNYQSLLKSEASYWLVQKLLLDAENNSETSSGSKVPVFERSLAFEDISFSYGDDKILENISFKIETGSFTAICGPSGSGKTTIADLVIGIQQPNSGAILVDSEPLGNNDPALWRRMIGYVPQEGFLFHESILNNVTLGDPDVTTDDAVAALKLAEAWDFVAALPDGIETVVGEHGSRFSGGQRQRISIARALVHKPRLLILDEATSALDPETEIAICQTLRSLGGGITILAISHGKEVARAADQAFRLQDRSIFREAA